MNIYVILQLSGLVVEIIGAFILSVEAIGLDRISGWVESITFTRERLSGKQKSNDSILRPSAARIIYALICGIGSGLGGWAGTWLGTHPPTWVAHFPKGLFPFISMLLGGFVGAISGLAVFHVIMYLLLFTISFLKTVELRTKAKSAGFIGFLLLLVGFVLQFIGTAGQAFNNPAPNKGLQATPNSLRSCLAPAIGRA